MAPLDPLLPHIYHERQQEGSMLCAEHALNNLFQGPYFTTTDLSTIAHELDEQEQTERYDDEQRPSASTNMDDSGFFSVQVLERALQVWGLTLQPWRSEKMRQYHDHPHTQLAFILNCSQHWYTLRRFGRVSPNPALEQDPDGGHWFDLNSFLPEPRWISKTYLGMTLHQAETEGYSVFAVVQLDPHGPLALPRTEGDEVALSLPEPSDTWYQNAPPPPIPPAATRPRVNNLQDFDFEDEDMELQAALQASLVGSGAYEYAQGQASGGQSSGEGHFTVPITTPPAHTPPSTSRGHRYQVPVTTASDPTSEAATPDDFELPYRRASRGYDVLRPPNEDDDEEDPPVVHDPVAASRARAQALMEQARREQEAALRDTYEEEQARMRAGLPSRRNTRLEQEEAELQRAIEESRALHEAQRVRTEARRSGADDEMDEGDEEFSTPQEEAPPAGAADILRGHRVYDDEDAEFQAALRASLETVPAGFRVPSPPPRPQPPTAPAVPPPQAPPPPVEAQEEHETETESEAESNILDEQPAEVSMEEMRRRRLARFGG